VAKSRRSFAITEEIEDTPFPTRFATRPGGVFERMLSTAA
jgi:hypothetical protein